MTRRRCLILFARAPRLGQGKRRLARGIGALAAWRFSRTLLADLQRRLGHDPRWRLVLALTPDAAAVRSRGWGRWSAPRLPQGGGDLGQRMARALACCRGPALLIGSDIPAVRPVHIAAAFAALGRCDFVFGPAEDGGFWLVGARRPDRLPRGLFAGVRWSTPFALADTLATLPARAVVGFVETLGDVDDATSFRRWRRITRL